MRRLQSFVGGVSCDAVVGPAAPLMNASTGEVFAVEDSTRRKDVMSNTEE